MHHTIQIIDSEGNRGFTAFQLHDVLRLTLPCGDRFAFEATASQFGWRETISPWDVYERQRVQIIHGSSDIKVIDLRKEFGLPSIDSLSFLRTAVRGFCKDQPAQLFPEASCIEHHVVGEESDMTQSKRFDFSALVPLWGFSHPDCAQIRPEVDQNLAEALASAKRAFIPDEEHGSTSKLTARMLGKITQIAFIMVSSLTKHMETDILPEMPVGWEIRVRQLFSMPKAQYKVKRNGLVEKTIGSLKLILEHGNFRLQQSLCFSDDMQICLPRDNEDAVKLKQVWFTEAEYNALDDKNRVSQWKQRYRQVL